MYFELVNRSNEIEFDFTPEQWVNFHETMSGIFNKALEQYPEEYISNVKRHGLMAFRLAMIFTLLRHSERLHKLTKVYCSQEDYASAIYIISTLLNHGLFILNYLGIPVLSELDSQLLTSLPNRFTRKDAQDEGIKVGLAERTIDFKLNSWSSNGLLTKVNRGVYKKK